MELKYGDAKAVASVVGSNGKLKVVHTTWRGDTITEVLKSLMVDHVVENKGKIDIQITINKE